MSDSSIDLRGTPCPVNFVRCSLAIESLLPDQSLHVYLDRGEPEEMVIPGLENAGHQVQIVSEASHWVKLLVICGDR